MKLTKPNLLSIYSSGQKKKYLKKAYLVIALLITGTLNALSKDDSQKVLISVELSNSPIVELFKQIQDQSDYLIIYNDKVVKTEKFYTLKMMNKTVNEILDQALSTTGLNYIIVGKQISIIPKKKSATSATNSTSYFKNASYVVYNDVQPIRGTVKDNKGEPLPGASVKVKGTDKVTSTDENGVFTIEAEAQSVLEVAFIGFVTKEIPVQGRSTINISLESETTKLEEVVVVGYGEQKKVNLTGAVSSVNFDEKLENRPITNPSQALAGKVTGVWVSQNSGAPGSDGATLRIRGFGTLNNTDPLVLIDGIEGRLAELNPNDIASMTVLKDAASAAIYGSRAANGVVLVTTKRGNYNADPTLSYNGYYGVQNLGRRYDLIDNSAEFMDIWNTAVRNNGGDPLFPEEVINAFRTGNDPYKFPNTNFFNEVFQAAPITEHNVSIRGGAAKQNYYFSVNYLGQDGIVKETNSKRYGLNFNLNSKVKDWLEIGGTIQATRKTTERPYNDISRAFYLMSNGGYPFTAPYTRNGEFGATQAVYLSGDRIGQPIVDSRNPLPDLYNGLTQYSNNFLKGSLNATVSLLPGLNFKTLYSGQFNNNRNDRYNERLFVYTDGGLQTSTLDFPTVINNIRSNSEEFYWAWYNTFNYDKKFGNHSLSGVAGMQVEDRQLKSTSVQRSSPPKEGLHEVDAGTVNPIANGNTTGWRMLSYFGRINYNLSEKYLFEANLRADASSRFKEGNRWGVFPSFSAGWRISEESFLKNSSLIDNMKIRASWGRLGNQNMASDYPYLVAITQNYGTSYNVGGQLVPGAAITALIDQQITWETTESTNLGFDLGFLKNRLNLEFDLFTKSTRDILVQLPIPQILGGVAAPIQNVGKMKNDGFELAVSYQSDPTEKNFNYRIGANVSHVINEVTKFRGGNSPDQLFLIREGISYRSLYGYKALGVFQSDQEAREYMANNSLVPGAGDLKYEDVNKDGRLDYQDKQVLGNTIPKYNFGLNLGATYKNWSLDVVTQGAAGVNAYTQNAWTRPLGISGGQITERWRNAWTPENGSNALPKIRINDTWNRYESSFWMSNISYFRVKNIQLSYNLPKKWLNNIKVQGATFYVNMQNLPAFVSGDYEGFDPERNTFDSGESLYPTPMISSFGANIQF